MEEINSIGSLGDILKTNSYPGRGIIIGASQSGTHAVVAYFIMGRSENSRNRIFVKDGDGIRTSAFEPSKLSDPTLVIYRAMRVLGNKTIVTNGDHTDTIYEGMDRQLTFEQALRIRDFEPDAPNYTPRISGIVHLCDSELNFNYALSIIKTDGGCPDSTNRFNFAYNNPCKGTGHFIHTYKHDGEPLPSFQGEPHFINICGDIDEFSNDVWNSLNEENKVSLYVRFIDIKSNTYEEKFVNKLRGD
ncbi:MAG: IMP cyclohydrolase [Oscillospiraceae bacterium]|nr:IMP cyclohydrolase [Oscillospiraceae bacterium]